MGRFSQLLIFLWKNLYVQKVKRHYLLTVSELVVALLAFAMVERDRPLPPAGISGPPYLAQPSTYTRKKEDMFSKPTKVLFCPNTHKEEALVHAAFQGIELRGYATHAEVVEEYRRVAPDPERGPDQNVIAVQLETAADQANFRYIIGFYDNTDFISRRQKIQPVFEPLPDAMTQRTTVAFAQVALSRAHRKRQSFAAVIDYDVGTQRLPQGPHPIDEGSRRSFMATRLGLAFVLPFCVLVSRLVKETQTGIKENLRLMGMRDAAYWMGHYYTGMIFGMLTSGAIVVYMSFVPYEGHTFLEGTNKTVVLFFFFLFCAQYAAIAMLLSIFFTNTAAAIVFSLCFWVTAYVVPCCTLEDWDGISAHYLLISPFSKLVSSFFLPCMGPHWCFRIIGCANLVGDPYGWMSVSSPVLRMDTVSMLQVWIAMICSVVVALLMLWYCSNVLPWAKGVPRPPWFPLTVRYWFHAKVDTYQQVEPVIPDGVRFEVEPPGVEAAVFVNRLELERTQVFILHETSFKAFPGEITVILGPTGSGKTALVHAITGFLLPASGQVIVCGFDIAEETRLARKELGVCQKREVFFDDLTVYETLRFVAVMREISGDVKQRIEEIQQLVGLSGDIGSALACSLTIPQRRFLAIAMAIMSSPRVLVLDEPSVGLDATARAFLWGVLEKVKVTGPTCILVTTSNAETEMLADRVAILGYGSLKCYGSRAFLRRRFGCGYNIRLTKMRKFQGKKCVAIAQKHIPQAYVVSDHKDAQVLGLGETASTHALSAVLHAFEQQYPKLGVSHISLFATTMEDVFIRLVLELEDKPPRRKSGGLFQTRRASRRMSVVTGLADDYDQSAENVVIETQKFIGGMGSQEEYYESDLQVEAHVKELCDLKPGRPSGLQVFKALLIKRMYYTRQTWALPFFCWLMPTAVLFWLCHFERATTGLQAQTLHISPDNIVYDLQEVYPGASVFLAYDRGISAIGNAFYVPLVKEQAGKVTVKRDIHQYLRDTTDERAHQSDVLLGASFGADGQQKGNVTAFYYGDAYHTEAVSLNLVNTALLRKASGNKNASVTAVFRPLRSDIEKEDSIRISNNNRTATLSAIAKNRIVRLIVMPFATAALLASFVFFPIDERATKAKRMQMLSGVSPALYWAANYVWDLVAALISLLCMFFPIFLCHPTAVSLMGHIVFLTLCYVHCTVPLVYFFSFVTTSMTAAFLVLMALLAFSGISSTLAFQLLMMSEESGIKLFRPVSRHPLLYPLYLLPPFSYHWSLIKVAQLTAENYICETSTKIEMHDICAYIQGSKDEGAVLLTGLRYCCMEFFHNNMTYLATLGSLSFHRDSAAAEMLVMIVQGVIFMLCLVAIDKGALRPLAGLRNGPSPIEVLQPDVAEERRIVEKTVADRDFSKCTMVVHDIQKVYGRRQALRGLSFQMRPGECLVILGLRGCGKSSLLDVLSGTEAPTWGTAYMPDTSLADVEKWQQRIGVCPQYDGILGKLTVRQTLWLYANLRGIDSRKVDQLVQHVIELLNLRFYDSIYVYGCNASTRRKLAVGIAIIGLPPVVLMDDPATGLDYFAKKKIYDTIRLLRVLVQASVVFVTHSMSDCVAVSDRMAILVSGQFQSIGTNKEVRSRLCKGCHLSLCFLPEQLKDAAQVARIDATVKAWFPTARLTAALHEQILEYNVELTKSWSEMFRLLPELKTQLQAKDLLIGETTLEHVMLRSARRQPAQANVRV